MKKTLLFLAFLTASQLAPRLFGTTFTVNNMNPSPGQYTTITAAVAAAAAGDIILVTGSPINYGTTVITKNNLTFIGAGYNPQKIPTYSTYVDNFHYNPNINGGRIMGFNLSAVTENCCPYNVDNITVEYCSIREAIHIFPTCDGWIIKNCVFTGSPCGINGEGSGHASATITNNIFDKNISICNFTSPNTGMLITNNVFLKGTSVDDGVLSSIDNATVENNIFYQCSATNGSITNFFFQNNLTFSAVNNTLPPSNCASCTGSGNIVNTDPLFTTYTSGQNFAYAHNFILQAGSPGKNAGGDGTDLGVFGLGNTFSETGEPPIPVIRTVTIANPNTASGAVLNVTVTATNPDPDQLP